MTSLERTGIRERLGLRKPMGHREILMSAETTGAVHRYEKIECHPCRSLMQELKE